MPLLLATNNAGKLREFRRLLQGVDIVSPADLGLTLDVEETGDTFAANAALKAEAFARAADCIALADDSGLEVDALGGEPGVLSARYGGPGLDDAGRYQRLLEALRDTPPPHTARFRCCLVARSPDGRTCQATGACEGEIAAAPAGQGGFGYDPVFYLPERGCTMAQLAPEDKNAVSHRSAALRALHAPLLRTFPELA